MQPHTTTGKAATLIPVMDNQRDINCTNLAQSGWSLSKMVLNLTGWLVEVQLYLMVDDSSVKLLLSGSTSWDQQGPLLVVRWNSC